MKNIILHLLLFLSVTTFAADDIILSEGLSFQYVYLETNEPYSSHGELMTKFYNECIKQNLEEYIVGKMLTIYFDDDIPEWRIAFEINQNVHVYLPLKVDGLVYPHIVKKQYTGNEIKHEIQILQFRIREMELHQTGPTVLRWTDISDLANPGVPEIDIIIPTCSIDSASFVLGKISRFFVFIFIAFYLVLSFLILFLNTRKSNILLSLFLFSSAMVLSGWVVGAFPYTVFLRHPFFYYIGEPFSFLPAPLLFLYTKSLIQEKRSSRKWSFIHFMPFCIVLILWVLRFYKYPAEIKRTLILSDQIFSNYENLAGFILLNAQIIGYIGTALVSIYMYRSKIKNSNGDQCIQFSWLSFVLYGFLVTIYIAYLKHFLYSYIGVYSGLLHILRFASNFAFIIIIFYKGVLHPELFVKKYQTINGRNPSLSENMFELYRKQLVEIMIQQKPYLFPEITLGKLSEMTSIPQRSLSEVINKGFHQNFFEFINTYRIEEAKRLISNSVADNKTILEILYEVGFNNKSVFNATFKKHTGKTPTEYRLKKVS